MAEALTPRHAPFGLVGPLSIVGDGRRDALPIPDPTPVHFMVPVDNGRAILWSVDGRGNRTKSDPHPRMPEIRGRRLTVTSSLGSGPLVFVDLDTTDGGGGSYYSVEYPTPMARFRSIERLVDAVCDALRRPCDKRPYADGDPPSPPMLREPDASISTNTATLEAAPAPSTSPLANAVTSGSPILAKRRNEWGVEFYIRVDREGSFHTYPDVGGPFRSVEHAEDAIDRHLQDRRVPSMCKEKAGVSQSEMVIRQCIFWPGGSRKRRTKSHVLEKARDQTSKLVHAVVDQYNEDHNLMGDFAYEPKDILQQELFRENNMSYHHLNFTANTKVGADAFAVVAAVAASAAPDGVELHFCGNKLFFTELKKTKQDGYNGEWVVSCFGMVGPLDNGPCYACTNGVKHPNKADAYTGGHVPPDVIGGLRTVWSDSDEDDDAREHRIRRCYEGGKPFAVPSYATPKVKKT